MQENKTTLTFREQYTYKQEIKAANENSWFCIIIGTILFLLCGYRYLCTTGILQILSSILAILGIILVFVVGFFPKITAKPVALIKKILGYIGGIITKLLLIPVFLIMTVLNLFIRKKYENTYMYSSWDNCDNIIPEFKTITSVDRKKKKYVFFQIISDIFTSLSQRKMYVLFPVAIILLIIGIILFFASSNAVFSFVYTLF